MKQKLLLIRTQINWADEMDLGGLSLFTESAWKKHLNIVKKCFSLKEFDGTMGIGSNQDLHFESFSKYKQHIKVVEISSKEAEFIQKTFNVKINTNNDFYSIFGTRTLFYPDDLEDILLESSSGKKWLKQNNYINDN